MVTEVLPNLYISDINRTRYLDVRITGAYLEYHSASANEYTSKLGRF